LRRSSLTRFADHPARGHASPAIFGAGGILGTGGELIWSNPVRPGDALRVEVEVIGTRPSRSRPEQGVVKVRVTTPNQHGETVQTFSPTLLLDRRSDSAADQR
jgi:acyl dehydratase